jgi:hypothetical protein
MLLGSLRPHTLCFHPQNFTALSLSELSIPLSPIYMNQIFIKRLSPLVQGPRDINVLLPTAQSFCQVPYFLLSCRANILFLFIELSCSSSQTVTKDQSRDLFPRFSFTLLLFFTLSHYWLWPHQLHWPSPLDEWKQYAIVHNVAFYTLNTSVIVPYVIVSSTQQNTISLNYNIYASVTMFTLLSTLHSIL